MMKIKIAYLGAGQISDRFILMVQKLKDVENAAIYSKHIENAKFKAQKYGIFHYYNNHIKMLKEIKPDAVVVCSSHSLHAKHTIDAMRYGAHVLVEKPFATNFKDALEMVKVSKKYKKILNPLPFDLYPNYLSALSFIKEKRIGNITSAHSELSFPGPPRNNWYYIKKIAKVGAILDVACYAISRLVSILGPAKKIACFDNLLIPKRILPDGDKIKPDVNDNSVIILEFSNKILATVKASWCHPFLENHTIVYGSKGAVFIGTDGKPLVIKTDKKIPGKKINFRNLSSCVIPLKFPPFTPDNDIIGNFVNAIRKGKQPVYNGEQGLHIMEIMDKAYKSSKMGKIFKLSTGFKKWWK